jgi:hypothetical protein
MARAASEFHARGFCVVETALRMTSREYSEKCAELTEAFDFDKDRLVWGGYGGSAYSDRHPALRKFYRDLVDRHDEVFQAIGEQRFGGEFTMLCLDDRFRHQPDGCGTSEKKHVDAPPGGEIPGACYVLGYANLGDVDIVAHISEGSHGKFQGRGHHVLTKEEGADYPISKITVPPGHSFLFQPSSVHEVAPQKAPPPGKDLFRRHFGCVMAPGLEHHESACLHRDLMYECCTTQTSMVLPSGQICPLYPKQYWVANKKTHLPLVMAWMDKNLVNGTGSVDHKTRRMRSLYELGVEFPPYNEEDLGPYDFKFSNKSNKRARLTPPLTACV